jgi:signal transduction histidine kinase
VRVSHRLLLTLLPAFIGLLAVVGLGYWGQYARQAPHVAVVTAAIALAFSVALALRNARYLAQRIERLASTAPPGSRDELESIERSVESLQSRLAAAYEEGTRREESLTQERVELTQLLADAAGAATQAVDAVRLPVHILLENRFGDLNENQEEMLGAAQASADEASALLRRLRLIADLERGSVDLRRDPLRVDDIVRGLLPTVQGVAAGRNVRVEVDLPPGLPRVLGDRTHLQEALAIVLRSAVQRTPEGRATSITAQPDAGVVRLVATHGGGPGENDLLERAVVHRLVRSMRASITDTPEATIVELPLAARPAG